MTYWHGPRTSIVKLQIQMDDDTKKEAFAVFKTGAEHGDVRSMRNLGVAYVHGDGVAQDYAKAREWYEKAAAKGDAIAMTRPRPALRQRSGRGAGLRQGARVVRESRAARQSVDLADGSRHEGEKAAAGQRAMLQLILVGRASRRTTPRRASGSRRPPPRATRRAMTNLGVLYEQRSGRRAGLRQGARVVRKGCRQRRGDRHDQPRRALRRRSVAWRRTTPRRASGSRRPPPRTTRSPCSTSACFTNNGQGVAQDYAKAREWYEKAAAKGDAIAMFNLGLLYENGQGVAQDYAKAREWYEKSIANGGLDALINLGDLYRDGHGVARDYAKGARIVRRRPPRAVYVGANARLEGLPT